tara:strand:- start:1766 stop:2452 length:687 start_codon:yes stop_codon:yes gene_type:complete
MVTVKLGDREVDIPSNWVDITFEQFLGFSELCKSRKSEEELKEKYENLDEEIKDLQITMDNIKFNTKLACYFTDLSEEEMAMCDMEQVEKILNALGFLQQEYMPIAISSFKIGDEEFFLPSKGMVKENFGTYIEAEQVELNNKKLEAGVLQVLPKQVAILCKKKGEKAGLIDDDLVAEREKKFKKLDMATIWDVGFFLLQQEGLLMRNFLTYLKAGETARQKLQQKEQ